MFQGKVRLRKISGKIYQCLDIGCDNLEAAARNRIMVKNKDKIAGYLEAENATSRTPLGQPLASWIPTGELPTVANEIWKRLSGVHIEDSDEEVIKVVEKVLMEH